jgi:hypothetical protein
VAASLKQQQHAEGLPREKYCRISLPQNQPIMSSTPPVLVVWSHNQFMTQNSHNSRTSNSCGSPVNRHKILRTYRLLHDNPNRTVVAPVTPTKQEKKQGQVQKVEKELAARAKPPSGQTGCRSSREIFEPKSRSKWWLQHAWLTRTLCITS